MSDELNVPHRAFRERADAWRDSAQEACNLAQLPHEGDEVAWVFAGPIMFRELWLVRYVLMNVLGVDEQLAVALGKRVLNEWHRLESSIGLSDSELELLGMTPSDKEPRA